MIFWADGNETRGTFHLNFKLKPGQENYIAIYDADGKTLIDEVTVPVIAPNTSYARTEDGGDEWEVRDGSTSELYVTPSSANKIRGVNPKIQNFKDIDANGFGMTVMAMAIVFSALLTLCICFYIISKIGASRNRSRKMEAQGMVVAETPREATPLSRFRRRDRSHSGSTPPAPELHDRESTILTINKVKRAYSPWSSKIYSIRQMPRR